MMHLITGYAGYEHIQSADDGAFNAAFFGDGQNVMEYGNLLSASIIDNNTVRIADGGGLMFGRFFRIPENTYEDANIKTGTAGVNRIDLICATYRMNEDTGVESVTLEVIEGTEATNAVMPAYTTGNILQGAKFNQMPLYKATLEGVVLKSVEPLFTTIPTYKALAERYARQFEQACTTHINSLNVLDTLEEIMANTQANQITGALALRQFYQALLGVMITKDNFDFDAETGTLNMTL